MVMVLVPVIVFVPNRPVAEFDGSGDTRVDDEFKCAVDGGNTDFRKFFMDKFDELIDREVLFTFDKYGEYLHSLCAVADAGCIEVGLEML